jgi:hypothetical protein
MPNARQMPSYTRVAHDLAFGFEVVATLDARTNSEPTRSEDFACREGQVLQVSRKRNGMMVAQPTVMPPNSTVPMPGPLPMTIATALALNGVNASLVGMCGQKPPVGNAQNTYGGDDYAWANQHKVHDIANRTIRWFDGPGVTYGPTAVAAKRISVTTSCLLTGWAATTR